MPFLYLAIKKGWGGLYKERERERERYNATQSGGCSSTKKDGQTVDTK
jgi:hypothetical protein